MLAKEMKQRELHELLFAPLLGGDAEWTRLTLGEWMASHVNCKQDVGEALSSGRRNTDVMLLDHHQLPEATNTRRISWFPS